MKRRGGPRFSRAYYAAYHAAARYVRDHGLVQTRHPHESVWKALANDADPTRVSVGTRGLEMKRARITADYLNPFPDDLALKVRDTAISARYVTATLDCLG